MHQIHYFMTAVSEDFSPLQREKQMVKLKDFLVF